jgi:hypothetical protein
MIIRMTALGCLLVSLALPAHAQNVQNMWWVEGDKFCGGFDNQFRNNVMCGLPRRGENPPSSTFRFEFNSPVIAPERIVPPRAEVPVPVPVRPQRRY